MSSSRAGPPPVSIPGTKQALGVASGMVSGLGTPGQRGWREQQKSKGQECGHGCEDSIFGANQSIHDHTLGPPQHSTEGPIHTQKLGWSLLFANITQLPGFQNEERSRVK